MFGSSNDNSQPQSGPVTSPTNPKHNINEDIPAAPPEPQGQPAGSQSSNNATVFPSNSSSDPFSTTPIIDDPSAAADPTQMQPAQQQVQSDDTAGSYATAQDNSDQTKDTQEEGESLIDIKQQALHELSPLVKHLNQNSEEKFKTTMMMIQASDDQSLVPEAFEAAKNIEDDKARAQALLDIINEINYFTQHQD